MTTRTKLQALADRWADVAPAERANYQLYLTELAEALDVPKPQPAGSGYQFELPVQMVNPDGTTTTRFADLVRNGFFLLEAKDAESGKSTDLLLRRAFGQAAQYTAFLKDGQPPYLLVLDVGATLLVWDRWTGTYGGFQAAHRINLPTLHERPEDIELLQDIWTRPEARDPRAKANAVTREIATKLAKLAASLEERGYTNERVAKFLMRCVFTMFAEDVDLLPDEPFKGAVALGLEDPADFSSATEELWAAMDEGRRFGLKKLLRFNGHFFREQEVLPLESKDLVVLHEAAGADWANVEPTIFGTLLTRALDPTERHKLGAEYTPREYVERLVRPTIDEPLRERWALVQAEVLQLRERGRPIDKKRAVARLRKFHEWLRGLRVLDPACGSGNFLYVALATIKSVELEVLREIEAITGMAELSVEEVGPWQFHGIEIKPWARELAELTLWVGYYQWWRQTHGHTLPPEPVLRETGTLECRDAVLAWDDTRVIAEKSRPDPTPRLADPVTGDLVPDPDARIQYVEYVGPSEAPWPEADFIVGNPPYTGNKRMREVLGDGYVDALRSVYNEVPASAEYVMYWWLRAAKAVARGGTIRAGLITTRSIADSQNRVLLRTAADLGAEVVWAVPDHPWLDDADAADVWVAMTVLDSEASGAVRVEVDSTGEVVGQQEGARLNDDLSLHADVATAATQPLLANGLLSGRGVTLVGAGFKIPSDKAELLLTADSRRAEVLRPYWRGSDVAKRPRDVYVLDFGMRTEEEARTYPVLFDLARTRVMKKRQSNNRASYREFWWRFGEPRGTFREALQGLPRYIATTYVGKHRIFRFVPSDVVPDGGLIAIGTDDPFILGVLSSRIHALWSIAAGGTQGVGHTPRYNNSLCFEPFPLPAPEARTRASVADLALQIEDHRDRVLAAAATIDLTDVYNVVEKLESGETLEETERAVHELAACGVLRDLHHRLDQEVASAYGWSWPMARDELFTRLVGLHDIRVAEEQQGEVRWVRAEFQCQRLGDDLPESSPAVGLDLAHPEGSTAASKEVWPEDVVAQLDLIRTALLNSPRTIRDLIQRFPSAKRSEIMAHLEALMVLGVVRENDEGEFLALRPHLTYAA